MSKAEFIALSACTMMLTALGIDIMLPVFGEIRQHFHLPANSTATANIVVFFFLGQVAQVIFGALSDRFGRLAILRVGFPLYILGGIAAAYAPSMATLFAARFVAGIGASAVFMTTIAGVRDRYVGDQMAHMMSLIFTIFLSTPVFAPFLGLAIMQVSSWRMVMLTPPLFAVIAFAWSLRLNESLPREKRQPLNFPHFAASVSQIFRNRIFLRYTAITTMLFTGLSSWVSSSAHIVSDIYHRPKLFAWVFGAIGLWMAICTLTNSRLASRFGSKPTLRWLLVAYTIVASLLLLWTLAFGSPPQLYIFVISVGLLLGINLAVEPNSSALAMEPMGNTAGLASSLYGTSFFFVGAGLGAIISSLLSEDVLPIVVAFFAIGLVTTLIANGDTGLRKETQ
ncbi:MFS transporter [Flavihumibacter petaseus]|uniref:Putative major facilitator superfamily transporter n=1 Tax=Flavihumibacter petaseus NBRC 106054 TaxID=1220578 RepID=A0A0E9N1W6_9BACT|nr:MFS transporter [Flavihumibacter petaseus]GAO43844.1 putative major facilitator superfamily transporter [Flavihumibacter petaseus NBRC 106054]